MAEIKLNLNHKVFFPGQKFLLVTLAFLFIFEKVYFLRLDPTLTDLPQVSKFINFNEILGFFSLGTN